MRPLFLSLLVSSLIATPLFAQQMGSVNRNAPTASQGITFANGSGVTIRYKSITWAEGKAMSNLAAIRDRVNASAQRSPLGSITIEGSGVTLGGKKLPSGKYSMAFMLDEQLNWTLRATVTGAGGDDDGEQETRYLFEWSLKLKEGKTASKRLMITITAGASDTQARLRLAFGKNSCTIPVFTGEKPKRAKKN